MVRTLGLGVLALTMLVATGCGVQGKWSLASVEPSAARRDFQYEVLTLEGDGSFYAEARDGNTRTTSGTYRYEKGVLSLREHDGEEHAYDAEVNGNTLKLKQTWEDRKLVASFDRK